MVVRQAGTANAFAPLLRFLKPRLDCDWVVLAYPPARHLLEEQGVVPLAVESFGQAVLTLQDRGAPRFTLTGTSFEARDDSLYWKWSHDQRRPALAFVDQWVNYAERFQIDAQGALPSHVLAIDEIAAKRLAELPVASSSIVVTGSPAFDDLLAQFARQARSSHLCAVFATEPITGPEGESHYRALHGFTDADALRAVLHALAQHAKSSESRWRLLVKPHPIDSKARIEAVLRTVPNSSQVEVMLTDEQKAPLLGAADVVFGTRSMLLYEAALLGLPTISVQPFRKTSSDLTDEHAGIVVITDPAQLAAAITAALKAPRFALRQTTDSCNRFLELLRPLVEDGDG